MQFAKNPKFHNHTLEKNLISTKYEGLEIFVEYSGQIDSFINILVRSLEEHTKILKVIKDEIVQPI